MIEKLTMMSKDKVQENIEKIQKLFPNAVTEVLRDGKPTLAVDFDVLKQEMSSILVDEREERYQMTWPDKKKSILLANSPISATLRPCKEESVDFDHTQNLYIEGDNLDVLKLLQETYLGKIKMIYIDPPYNTGNDFIYNDDFAMDSDEYMEVSGQYDEQGNRLSPNTESNGRFHTNWLNMIYPRLKVAKDLLAEDGVIFISIDENEVRNLGRICDEVFGENNFVECFVYDKKAAPKGVPPVNMVCGVHEYIYVYARSFSKFVFNGIPRSPDGFSNPDNDPRGIWRNTNIKSTTSENKFSIIDPKTGNTFVDTWAFAPSELEKMVKEGRLLFPDNPQGQVRAKEYYFEFRNANTPIKSSLGLYDAQWNTEMLVKLMGGKVFQNPKHLRLIKNLISFTVNPTDIILDFFSGSATTAHAVMQLNAEDGGNRKYIMVQLPERCDENSEAYKAGYKTICDIGKERIRRAGKKIKEENPSANNLDIGFRVLKLDSSNMKDVYYKSSDYAQDLLSSLESNIKEDRTSLDLLFQVMLELGKPLSAKIEEQEIAGKKVYVVDDDDMLIACFDENVTEDVVKTIAEMKPRFAVFRDSSFSSDTVAANFEQIFATYSPNTTKKVL